MNEQGPHGRRALATDYAVRMLCCRELVPRVSETPGAMSPREIGSKCLTSVARMTPSSIPPVPQRFPSELPNLRRILALVEHERESPPAHQRPARIHPATTPPTRHPRRRPPEDLGHRSAADRSPPCSPRPGTQGTDASPRTQAPYEPPTRQAERRSRPSRREQTCVGTGRASTPQACSSRAQGASRRARANQARQPVGCGLDTSRPNAATNRHRTPGLEPDQVPHAD